MVGLVLKRSLRVLARSSGGLRVPTTEGMELGSEPCSMPNRKDVRGNEEALVVDDALARDNERRLASEIHGKRLQSETHDNRRASRDSLTGRRAATAWRSRVCVCTRRAKAVALSPTLVVPASSDISWASQAARLLVASAMIGSSAMSAPTSSPVTTPSRMTTTRSAMPTTSESSELIIKTAMPLTASSRMMR
jgi:hypothetical protein